MKKTLFDDYAASNDMKEDGPLERLRDLDKKIADAINKVKTLKEEKVLLERKIKELEARLDEKNQEVERIASEKTGIKTQIEELLNELEGLDIK